MKKRIYSILIFAGISTLGFAQQTSTMDHYLVQPYFINPSAAGMNGTSIFLDYRRQWAGFTGAPETQLLTVDGAIKRDKMGVGLTVLNDQVNVLGSTTAMATYAYRVKFAEDNQLRFGVSAGLVQNRIIFSRVIAQDPTELQIFQDNQNSSAFDGAAGILYQLKNFQIGFSATQLFGGRFYYEDNFQDNSLRFQNIRHFMVNTQYRFDIKKGKWGVMPSAQLRSVQGMKLFYEGGLTGFYRNDAWMTVRYAHLTGLTASIGGVIAKNIVAGYAYSFSTNAMNGYNQGTHDIVLGFRIASGKKSGSGGIDEKQMNELLKKNNELFEKADYLKAENDALRKELEDQKKAIKEAIYGLDSLKSKMGANLEELNKLIEENQKIMDGNASNGNNGSTTNGGTNSGTNNSGSNNGTNSGNKNPDQIEDMLPGKVYIVVGAVKELENAKLLQKIVKREYGEDTYVVRDDNDYWFFVYTKSFDSKEEARTERDRADAMDTKKVFIGDPWYYISKKK